MGRRFAFEKKKKEKRQEIIKTEEPHGRRTDGSLLFLLLAAGLGRHRNRGRLERRMSRVLIQVTEQLRLGIEDGVAACTFL